MASFLYISPYFAPMTRAGALDPLKFVRAMPQRGWRPVVLADMWPGVACDRLLADAIPQDIPVYRQFSNRAGAGGGDGSGYQKRLASRGSRLLDHPAWPVWLARQEWLPLGDIGFYVNHAVARGLEILKRHPCELIVAQSTPYASLVAGEILARKTGLPLVCKLGDPWRVCALKRHERPVHTRMIQRRLENRVIARASRYVLYTRRAVEDYRALYPHIDPDFFVAIHNGYDLDLVSRPWQGTLPRNSILFFGSFSPHIRFDPALHLLAELRGRGDGGAMPDLYVTSALPRELQRLADKLKVAGHIKVLGHQSYRCSSDIVSRAGVLLSINATAQRIVAKTYDYLPSNRPMLTITPPHRELEAMMEHSEAGRWFRPDQISAMADFVQGCLSNGAPGWPRSREVLEDFDYAHTADLLSQVLSSALREGHAANAAGTFQAAR